MSRDGVRPNKLWHWGAILVIAATVWKNPGGSAEFAITTLDLAGTVLGGALDGAGYDGDSHYFTPPDKPPPNPDLDQPAGSAGPLQPAEPEEPNDGDGSVAAEDGDALRGEGDPSDSFIDGDDTRSLLSPQDQARLGLEPAERAIEVTELVIEHVLNPDSGEGR